MNEYPTCGLWPAHGSIAASVLDGEGRLHRLLLAPTDDEEAWDSVGSLERDFGLDLRLVVPDCTAPLDALVRIARLRRTPMLVVSRLLAESIGAVAYARPRAAHLASILARLPDSRFRNQVRWLRLHHPHQLTLL
jgi:hypothetical protein